MRVRLTGFLVEDKKVLLIKQRIVSSSLNWGLPGGGLIDGELIDVGLKREIFEETGLKIKIIKFLYVKNRIQNNETIVELVFKIKKIGGKLTLPKKDDTNETETIKTVKMVPLSDFVKIGLSEKYAELIKKDFPLSGVFLGTKKYDEIIN